MKGTGRPRAGTQTRGLNTTAASASVAASSAYGAGGGGEPEAIAPVALPAAPGRGPTGAAAPVERTDRPRTDTTDACGKGAATVKRFVNGAEPDGVNAANDPGIAGARIGPEAKPSRSGSAAPLPRWPTGRAGGAGTDAGFNGTLGNMAAGTVGETAVTIAGEPLGCVTAVPVQRASRTTPTAAPASLVLTRSRGATAVPEDPDTVRGAAAGAVGTTCGAAAPRSCPTGVLG